MGTKLNVPAAFDAAKKIIKSDLKKFEFANTKSVIWALTSRSFETTIEFTMDTTQTLNWRTFNTTDVRFRLGRILTELQRHKNPVLIISRSKPCAWLYPYEVIPSGEGFFTKWQKEVLPKYSKIKAKDLIALIRKDRDQR